MKTLSRFLIALLLLLSAFLVSTAAAHPSLQAPVNIRYGETIQATIPLSASMAYVFEANPGDTINVIAAVKDPQLLNLVLSVFDPSNNEIAVGQSYPDIGVAVLEMRLEQGGSHQIVIQAVLGEGDFELTLQGRAASAYQTVFLEDFDENDASWETASQVILPGGVIQTSELSQGSYNVAGTWTSASWYWVVAPGLNNWAAAPVLTPPYEVEVEFSNVQSSTGNYLIGLAIYVQENYAGYYQLAIQQRDGVANGLSFQDAQKITDWKDFEGIALDGGPHRLRIVVKSGQEYIVWLDNHFVYRLVYETTTDWENGSIGLVLSASRGDQEATISASFDNLTVRVPAPASEVTCVVEAVVVANVRTAPDPNSTVQRQLAVGTIDTAVGQATGTDGYLWWNLQDGNWVHSAVVIAESKCGDLPQVSP